MQGLARNLSDLTMALSRYDILLCSETLVSDIHYVSVLLVPRFGRPVLLYQYMMLQDRGMAAYTRDGYGAFCPHKLSVVVVKCWFLGFVVQDRLICVKSLPQP